jgi:chromate transport protein ChrA
MFGLAIGVSHIGESLPAAVYALLSGLNAATVGIIALAAVELARKAISDRLTRALVFLCAAVGLLFNALWYFPVLMAAAGLVTVIYDFRWLHRPARAVLEVLTLRRRRRPVVERGEDGAELSERETGRRDHVGEVDNGEETPPGPSSSSTQPPLHTSPTGSGVSGREGLPVNEREAAAELPARRSWTNAEARFIPPDRRFDFSWKLGLAIISLFFVSFVVVLVLRGMLPHKPILYSLFANLYLAGTIIIGGGPVVIPLLREYVVTEGWVSGRDFLIGLALIQGFPGPNFNFAVYLGALTAISAGKSAAAGALIGFLGIFTPGLVLVQGTMGVWGAIRGWRAVRSAVRGIQASAIGFIYTAVYRLWQIGWFEEGSLAGTSLGNDPWWVVVTATSFVGGAWFGVSPPVAIVIGAVMGLLRYAVVQSS